MLNESRAYLRTVPTFGIFPGLALAILLLGLNFLSDALRDALEPAPDQPLMTRREAPPPAPLPIAIERGSRYRVSPLHRRGEGWGWASPR